MRNFVRWVLSHRGWVLAICGLISLAAVLPLQNAIFANSLGKLFFGDSPAFVSYKERVAQFASDEILVIGLEGEGALDPRTLDRLERVQADLELLTSKAGDRVVRRVHSVLDAKRVAVNEGTLSLDSFAEQARMHPERRAALIDELRNDPFYGSNLISKDGKHLAVIVELEPGIGIGRLPENQFTKDARRCFERAGFGPEGIYIAGMPAVMESILASTLRNFTTVIPIVPVVLSCAVFLLFRQLWPVVMASFVALLGTLWMMGLAATLDPEISVLHGIAPLAILVIATSDVIHLCSAYLLEIERGKPRDQAIEDAATEVGLACVYTSLTTFAGFVAVSFVPTPLFRMLGVVMGAGVGITLLLAVTLVPTLLSYLPEPRPWRAPGQRRSAQGAIDRFLSWVGEVSTRRPGVVVACFLALSIVTAVGLSRFTIETRLAQRIPPEHPTNVANAWFNGQMQGATILQIYLDRANEGGWLEPGALASLAELSDRLETQPGVSGVGSIVDVIRRVHDRFHDGAPAQPLPQDRATIAQYILLLEMEGLDVLEELLSFDRKTVTLTARMSEEGVRAVYNTGTRARTLVPSLATDEVTIEPSGLVYLTGDWLGAILAGQRRGLIFSLIAVTLMMILAMGSLWVGLWSMIPNVLPVLVLGGTAGLLINPIDSDALLIGMLAIGVGVDDTIHFLMRYRIESARHDTVPARVQATLAFAGRGILITTVVLGLGFMPALLSDYLTFQYLGSLLPWTLLVALVSDLFLVPALAALGVLRWKTRT